jgi:5-methylcytosine-specific restriction endonuclease McrA
MGMPRRFTNEQIIEAYKATGSIWAAAKRLGMCGQSVWERLKSMGYRMVSRRWTAAEFDELRLLAGQCTIAEIGRRLGRPTNGVAIKISRLGLTGRYRQFATRKHRQAGRQIDADTVRRWIHDLAAHQGSVRQFARARAIDLELLVQAIQRYDMPFWREYVRTHTSLKPEACPYCSEEFLPITKKQRYCTRKCAANGRADAAYFGGRRRQTIGLAEGTCQLCRREIPEGLSSHHVFGRENDPDSHCLIALCRGCHQVVGRLAALPVFESEEAWQQLISLVLSRRMLPHIDEQVGGVHVAVDIDYWSHDDMADFEDEQIPKEESPTC